MCARTSLAGARSPSPRTWLQPWREEAAGGGGPPRGVYAVGSHSGGGWMAQELRRGDRVEWNFRGAKVVGTVRRKLTSRTVVNGSMGGASKDAPGYLVRSKKTGKETTRRGASLRRLP